MEHMVSSSSRQYQTFYFTFIMSKTRYSLLYTLYFVVKRAQELLMFGNQQNRQATENSGANNFSPSAEKSKTFFLLEKFST